MIIRMEDLIGSKLEQAKQSCAHKKFLILVHPHFTSHNAELEKFLKSKESKNTIIILGEEHTRRSATEKWLNDTCPTKSIITYSTIVDEGNPVMGWQRFLKKLELLGGTNTKIIVGGNRLVNMPSKIAKVGLKQLKVLEKSGFMSSKEAKKMKSVQRTLIRAISNGRNRIAHSKCAGFTASKIKAHGKFKVNVTKRFTH